MPKEVRADVKELRIGQKIRELRQQKHFTLQNVSEVTGLSRPLLSQIENEVIIPPIATLLKICRALNVGIGYFFHGENDQQKATLVREHERQKVNRRVLPGGGSVGYSYESLAYGRAAKNMEPFLVEFDVKDRDEVVMFDHEGEEFLFALEGELEFHYRGEVFTLHAGDSLYFDSGFPHGFRALGKNRAKAVVVVYAKK